MQERPLPAPSPSASLPAPLASPAHFAVCGVTDLDGLQLDERFLAWQGRALRHRARWGEQFDHLGRSGDEKIRAFECAPCVQLASVKFLSRVYCAIRTNCARRSGLHM